MCRQLDPERQTKLAHITALPHWSYLVYLGSRVISSGSTHIARRSWSRSSQNCAILPSVR